LSFKDLRIADRRGKREDRVRGADAFFLVAVVARFAVCEQKEVRNPNDRAISYCLPTLLENQTDSKIKRKKLFSNPNKTTVAGLDQSEEDMT